MRLVRRRTWCCVFLLVTGCIPFYRSSEMNKLIPPAMNLAAVRVLQWSDLNLSLLALRHLQHTSSALVNPRLSQRTMPANRRTSSTRATSNAAPEPRLSASLLLVNAKNEVLMIQRTKESRTFAGMHVCPTPSRYTIPETYSEHRRFLEAILTLLKMGQRQRTTLYE